MKNISTNKIHFYLKLLSLVVIVTAIAIDLPPKIYKYRARKVHEEAVISDVSN